MSGKLSLAKIARNRKILLVFTIPLYTRFGCTLSKRKVFAGADT